MLTITHKLIDNDIRFYQNINQLSDSKFIYQSMKLITHLGSTAFAAALSLCLLIADNEVLHFLIANLLVSQLIIHSIKRIINRPRPYKTLINAKAINPPRCKYSFPSGHSSSALTIALVLAQCFPLFSIFFIPFGILVGISRILLGFHYPSDVLAGFMISSLVFLFI